jgi:ABC-type bacteriocin/lantibiotic exporter with double-glycine peptidase domain
MNLLIVILVILILICVACPVLVFLPTRVTRIEKQNRIIQEQNRIIIKIDQYIERLEMEGDYGLFNSSENRVKANSRKELQGVDGQAGH